MLEPIETPEMLVMQERLYALANEMDAFADEIESDEHIEDAEYTAGMMRLNAKRMRLQGRDLEDKDDATKVDMFVTAQELEIHRARAKIREAREAHARGEHHTVLAKRWFLLAKISGGIFLFAMGYNIARLIAG